MNSLISKAIFTLVLMTNMSVHAQTVNKSGANKLAKAKAAQSAKGGVATGGGDLCEDRIKIIRDDLRSWIVRGGAKNLQLPAGVSSGKYSDDMLEQILAAKVRCVTNGDAGYPVTVDGVPKVCRFDRSTSSSLITCDFNKFQAMAEGKQYELIHHEYAGLADIEKPNGSDSNYDVSNQITSNLVSQNVLKLTVIPKTVKNITNVEEVQAYAVAAKNMRLPDVVYYKDSSNTGEVAYNLVYFLNRATSAQIEQSGNTTQLIFDCFGYMLDERFLVTVTVENNQFSSVVIQTQISGMESNGDFANPVTKKGWITKREVKIAKKSFTGSRAMGTHY